jgi:pseudouridine-5'-phosphate glycosidase
MAMFLRLLRARRNTSQPVTAMSAEEACVFLQGLRSEGQFAVFQLPETRAFVQAMRTSAGGLHIEVSQSESKIEALLQSAGPVSRSDLGFLVVESRAGEDTACGTVIAQALTMLAKATDCENLCRVRTGAQ